MHYVGHYTSSFLNAQSIQHNIWGNVFNRCKDGWYIEVQDA
jgi:hypothetical protein